MKPVIDKIDRKLLLEELTSDKLLRSTNKGGNEIYIVDAFDSPNTMREIGRLRELAFRAAGGGTGLDCDIDEFDTMETPCRQLIVWNPETQEILGGYRFILGEDIRIIDGRPNIACAHMFNFSPEFMDHYLPRTIELGRSFVVLDYQNTSELRPKSIYVLDNLWDGLSAVTMLYPQIEYLFGKVTMYPKFGVKGRDMILAYMHRHFPDPERLVWPIDALDSDADSPEFQSMFSGDLREDMLLLNQQLRQLDRKVPPLVNAYMALSPSMRVFGTAINREFGDVEETGILLHIPEIYEEKKKRHFESFDAENSPYGKKIRKTN